MRLSLISSFIAPSLGFLSFHMVAPSIFSTWCLGCPASDDPTKLVRCLIHYGVKYQPGGPKSLDFLWGGANPSFLEPTTYRLGWLNPRGISLGLFHPVTPFSFPTHLSQRSRCSLCLDWSLCLLSQVQLNWVFLSSLLTLPQVLVASSGCQPTLSSFVLLK